MPGQAVARPEDAAAPERVHRDREVELSCGAPCARFDHERAVQATLDLVRRELVRVVPEGSELLGPEAIRVGLAGANGVLRHSGHAVLAVRDVDAVPVHRDPVVEVLVPERHLDEVALVDAELGPGNLAVEGQRVDLSSRIEPDPGLLRGEHEADVGAAGSGDEVGDARPGVVMVAGRGSAAVLGGAVVHHGIRPGKSAVVPRLGDEREHGKEREHGDDAQGACQLVHGRTSSSWR
jgi:hypothetical protein